MFSILISLVINHRNIYMRYIFTILSLCFLLTPSKGQITQTNRFELPFKYSDENYLIASAGKQGIVLFRELKEKNNKKEAWEILMLDTSLIEKLTIITEIDYKYSIIGYEYREGYFYLLFKNSTSSKSDFFLIKTSLEDGTITNHEIASELMMDESHLLINDQSIVLGGYINSRSTFVVLNYLNNKVQVVPGFFNVKNEVLDFNYDKKHDLFNVLMGQKGVQNQNEIAIKSFDSNGKVHVDEKYQFDENWRALNGCLIFSQNNQIMISGSYAANNSYYSQGYYFGSLAPGKRIFMKYIGFTDIDHFFDYMNPNRAKRIKSKIENTRNSNKSYEFKTLVYVHQLKEYAGKFLLISELYKPEYKRGSSSLAIGYSGISSYRDQTGQKYVNRSSRLTNTDGASHISYQETVVLGINEKGKLLWNQSLSLKDVETLALEQVTEVYKKGEKGVLLYKKENQLAYNFFNLDTGISSDSTIAINTFNELDQISLHSERQGRVQHWYDNNFIVWGYQKISNEKPEAVQTDKKRNIFFINKLVIE